MPRSWRREVMPSLRKMLRKWVSMGPWAEEQLCADLAGGCSGCHEACDVQSWGGERVGGVRRSACFGGARRWRAALGRARAANASAPMSESMLVGGAELVAGRPGGATFRGAAIRRRGSSARPSSEPQIATLEVLERRTMQLVRLGACRRSSARELHASTPSAQSVPAAWVRSRSAPNASSAHAALARVGRRPRRAHAAARPAGAGEPTLVGAASNRERRRRSRRARCGASPRRSGCS